MPEASPARIWAALGVVYVVWGSTYLAIRVMVESIPPLLGAGARFAFAGAVVLAAVRGRRPARARLSAREWASAALVGTLLAAGGNGLVTIAEQDVPSALAALIIASVPLWIVTFRTATGDRVDRVALLGVLFGFCGVALLLGILLPGANAVVTVAEVDVPSNVAALLIAAVPLVIVLLRRATGEGVSRASLAGVLLGFAGVALLLAPGGRPGGASLLGMAGCLVAAIMWATGSFSASKLDLPAHPLVSTGWQMLLGGAVITVAGWARGEAVRPAEFSGDSLIAFAYLVLIGSLVAYTAYAWLLRNVPVSKVATYAYVNPVVAIALGWLVLGETITGLGAAGAAVIVGSVAVVVRAESVKR